MPTTETTHHDRAYAAAMHIALGAVVAEAVALMSRQDAHRFQAAVTRLRERAAEQGAPQDPMHIQHLGGVYQRIERLVGQLPQRPASRLRRLRLRMRGLLGH